MARGGDLAFELALVALGIILGATGSWPLTRAPGYARASMAEARRRRAAAVIHVQGQPGSM